MERPGDATNAPEPVQADRSHAAAGDGPDGTGAVGGRTVATLGILADVGSSFDIVFDRSTAGLAVVDRAGRLRAVNPALSNLLGRPEPELLGSRWVELIHPDHVREAIRHARSSAGEEDLLQASGACRMRTASGWELWCTMVVSAIGDGERSDLLRVFEWTPLLPAVLEPGVIDASQLRERADHGDAILEGLEAMGEAMLLARGQLVVYVNHAFCRLTGYEPGELLGRPFPMALLPVEDRSWAFERRGEFEQGEATSATHSGRLVRKDGTTIRVESAALLVGGGLQFISFRDATSRSISERARHMLDALVDASDDAIITKDALGIVLSWNAAAERMFGLTASEAVGHPITHIVPPHLHHEELQLRRRAFSGAETRLETMRLDRNGRLLAVAVHVTPVRGEFGDIVAALAIVRDVTHRRRSWRVQRSARHAEADPERRLADVVELRRQFTSVASHELRTPVASIHGFATTLESRWDELAEVDRRSFVHIICEAADRLHQVVGNLLMLATIESGEVGYEPSEIAVRPVLEELVDSFGDASITIHCDESVHLLCDVVSLRQMLFQCIANARQYGRGPIDLRVDVEPGGEHVVLRVCDRGHGVRPRFARRMFEPFAQESRGDTREARGLGLGLALVARLAEANGGMAWHEAGTPVGFSLCIRLRAVREPARVLQRRASSRATSPAGQASDAEYGSDPARGDRGRRS